MVGLKGFFKALKRYPAVIASKPPKTAIEEGIIDAPCVTIALRIPRIITSIPPNRIVSVMIIKNAPTRIRIPKITPRPPSPLPIGVPMTFPVIAFPIIP